MHELSVTQALLDAALRHAAASGALRVTEVRVVLGDLASVVDDSVRAWWDEVARGTLCEGSSLVFERVAARVLCTACGREYGLPDGLEPCPGCGGASLRVTAGDECRLESLTIVAREEASVP